MSRELLTGSCQGIDGVRSCPDAIRFIGGCVSRHDSIDSIGSLRTLLARNTIDWLVVVGVANHHAVTPALWAAMNRKGLADLLPDDVRAYLPMLYDLNRRRNHLIREQVLQAASCLNSHDIRPILMKGALGLLEDGGDEGAVIMTDADLLVRHVELPMAITALRSLGYELLAEPHAHACTLHRPMSLVTIDLHSDVGPQRALLSPDAVYAAASHINRTDVAVDALAVSHRVLVLLMTFAVFERHYLAGHIPMRGLSHLADLCGRCGPDIDWNYVLETADRHRLCAQAASMFHMARELINVPVPIRSGQSAAAHRHLRRCFLQLAHPTFDRVMHAYATFAWPFNQVRMDYRHNCGTHGGSLTAARIRHAIDVLLRRSSLRGWRASTFRRRA